LIALCIVASCGLNSNENKNQKFGKPKYPLDQFVRILSDSFNVNSKDSNFNKFHLDSISEIEIFDGHFTDKNQNEIALKQSFINLRFVKKLEIACIFSLEDNDWKPKRVFKQDRIKFIDFDKDSIYEIFYSTSYFGNGSINNETKIFSIKRNEQTIIFYKEDFDNKGNIGAYSISKVGDTIVNTAEYIFLEQETNIPIKLKENRLIGIKKGVDKHKDSLLLEYFNETKVYEYVNGSYK
jgi:hypothetical protein